MKAMNARGSAILAEPPRIREMAEFLFSSGLSEKNAREV
jgi:hypothetical protein